MANIKCACTGNKIRLKKKSPDRAMANTSATIAACNSATSCLDRSLMKS